MLANLSAGLRENSTDVLRDYVSEYIAPETPRADEWVAWLKRWGWPFANDTAQAQRDLAVLIAEAATDSWRFRHWELKSELMHEHTLVQESGETTPAGLEAIERFWAVHEKIMRGVYGLGPQRHGFAKHFSPVSWQQTAREKLWAKDA